MTSKFKTYWLLEHEHALPNDCSWENVVVRISDSEYLNSLESICNDIETGIVTHYAIVIDFVDAQKK